jgi:hypothetical protein
MVLHLAVEAHPHATAGGEEVYRRATQTLGAAYMMDLRSAMEAMPPQPQASHDGGPKPRPPAEASPRPQTPGPIDPPPPGAPNQPRAPSPGGLARKDPPAAPAPPFPIADPPTAEASRSVQSFHLLGGVADKALAMGKAEDAERILQVLLADVIARARDGNVIDSSVCESAARYAARLGGATGKASWVDYVFELYRRQRRVLPAVVIDELYSVVRKVKGLELGGIRAYLDALREGAAFGPAERFLVQRIEGLERQMALK